MDEIKQPSDTSVSTYAVSVVNDEVVINFGRAVQFVHLTVPAARQMMNSVRHAANVLERQLRGTSNVNHNPNRRRVSRKKSR